MERGYQNPISANPSAKTAKKKKSGFFGRGALKLRNTILKLLGKGAIDAAEVDPDIVWAQIPRSWFTKKGPGVLRSAQIAYACMSPEQRELSIERGWLPQNFARMSDHRLRQLQRR